MLLCFSNFFSYSEHRLVKEVTQASHPVVVEILLRQCRTPLPPPRRRWSGDGNGITVQWRLRCFGPTKGSPYSFHQARTTSSRAHAALDEFLDEAKPSVVSSLFGGAVAGCVAKTTIAPLDRTKIYFQVSSTRGYSFKSAFKFVIRTYREHGFLALFRGNSATMVRVMPYAAIQFAAFEQYRHWLNVDIDGKRTPGRRCIVGSMAGATATCITYPLDTAKARLSISTKKEYATLMSVFVKTAREGGVLSLYRGLWPTVLGASVLLQEVLIFFPRNLT
ncbi:hypothetical protein Y032_0043g724 [Ancylostoma ceylanicum]|uniref:Mitochondrial carrier protein n=1 Tax=Ancylostoma ceylanicum TaxID=53326 RepID=A0A016UF31_9BILA|nr:hypothetical protein Y032_0043g724 [Ancylostoma ceylanicum]